jgi:hypothetical protein
MLYIHPHYVKIRQLKFKQPSCKYSKVRSKMCAIYADCFSMKKNKNTEQNRPICFSMKKTKLRSKIDRFVLTRWWHKIGQGNEQCENETREDMTRQDNPTTRQPQEN